jgi:hypothetical protein
MSRNSYRALKRAQASQPQVKEKPAPQKAPAKAVKKTPVKRVKKTTKKATTESK